MGARFEMKAARAALRAMDAYAAMERVESTRPLTRTRALGDDVEGCETSVARAEALLSLFEAGNPGKRGAEALRLHYLALMRWDEVAEAMGMSNSGARTAARVALAWLDAEGR